MKKALKVQREIFTKNDKEYFSYFIKGNVRGKDVKVAICPPDKGGYSVLDVVFGDEMEAELMVNPYEIKDEVTGRVIKGNTYEAQCVDRETGEIFKCPIKPFRTSDKSFLSMLIN